MEYFPSSPPSDQSFKSHADRRPLTEQLGIIHQMYKWRLHKLEFEVDQIHICRYL